MSKVLIVIGSARKGRVADTISGYVQAELATLENISVTIADLKEIDLPFFDNESSPLSPGYVIANPKVLAWSQMVQAADSIIFITPEYNHAMTAIQKNALDSLGVEWDKKSVTVVAYGWSGGSLAVANFQVVAGNLKADIKPSFSELRFMKDLNPDGSLLDETSVTAQIKATINEILSSPHSLLPSLQAYGIVSS